MNKHLKNTSALLAIAIVLSIVSGCKFWANNSGGETNKNPLPQNQDSNSKKTADNTEKSAKTGLAKEIIGTWKGNPDQKETITLNFKDNGSVSIITDDGEEKSTVDAKYRATDEKTIEITFADGKKSRMTEIKINGDTMQANGKNGRPGTFKRVS